MVLFPNLLHNVYPVFLVKSIVIVKAIRLNKKQIKISSRFVYIKYKF